MPETYFEDLSVGDTERYGTYEVTAEEIVAFAEQYDPQPFHTDPEAAADSAFGELVASGWHTTAMTMRLLVEGVFSDAAARGAIGVDDLRWPHPVTPGDELAVETEILETSDWDEDAGLVEVEIRTLAGDEDETVCSMVGLVLFGRKDVP
jgi:acyl dehydratase